ncbi:rhombotarget A [Acinetobacter sp. 187]|uniref:rhombotarget A n=1 Tax=Acinetobacter lanii TaxID=2715163 RepID=UPI00140CC844|nr:rhombotarget A [Acinetobacter lanii]NHC04256.1 rhombotarget A [Acinetobacter lanii]
MHKHAFALLMLGLSGQALAADLVVTTTEDVVKADSECSLREAIEYVNQGLPEAGYNGCGGKDASNVIFLSEKEYKLNSQITISKDLTLKTQYDTAPTDNVYGKHNAVIKMAGTDRIFNIDRTASTLPPSSEEPDKLIQVSLYEVTLKGCDAASCKDQGGLIYNKESLSIEYGQLLNGKARLGGAIYNVVPDITKMGSVIIENSLIQGNKANNGAVVYGDLPQYSILKSVLRDNEATDANGALFDAAQGFTQEQSLALGIGFLRGLQNATIFNNKGYVIRVMDSVMVNNVTMLFNSKGLLFDAPNGFGSVVNSILAKNGSADCTFNSAKSNAVISNNLYSVGCEGIQSQALGSINLIAGSASEGQCDISSDGLLCPFKEYEGFTLGYFKPRLLVSYKTLDDSLIVNQGPNQTSSLLECASTDQRSKGRPGNKELCDRGAVELLVDRTAIKQVGDDILYGEKGKMSIADQLADGELITPAQCQALFGNPVQGMQWQPGCMKIVQTNTPSKGTLTMTQDGEIVYTPNGDWHGSDEFKILVVTSTTRFSDSLNPYIEIPAKIVQDPPNDFKDYKVKTSGGAYGLGGLLILLGLIGLRRSKRSNEE